MSNCIKRLITWQRFSAPVAFRSSRNADAASARRLSATAAHIFDIMEHSDESAAASHACVKRKQHDKAGTKCRSRKIRQGKYYKD